MTVASTELDKLSNKLKHQELLINAQKVHISKLENDLRRFKNFVRLVRDLIQEENENDSNSQ